MDRGARQLTVHGVTELDMTDWLRTQIAISYFAQIYTFQAFNEWEASFLIFWPHRMAFGILSPQPGTESAPPELEVRRLNH